MDKIKIIGGQSLSGKIRISGAKNAALPLMCTSLLTKEPVILKNLPRLADVFTLGSVLSHLGVKTTYEGQAVGEHQATFHAQGPILPEAPYDLVRKMRASFLVLGPLLARTGYAKVSLPGGCAIGSRPVDIHLKGVEALGAEISLEDGYVIAKAPNGLRGAEFAFPVVTVTGTENILMAAVLAQGTTRLLNCAVEPEVTDLAHCLQTMGAQIEGIGTPTLIIKGVSSLHGTTYSVLPDRIETSTYAMAAGITGGEIELLGTDLDLMPTVSQALEMMGMTFTKTSQGFIAKGPSHRLKAIEITTDPYPGFATDVQAQIMALACVAEGTSSITETIWENRFMHVPELARMGADITIKGNTAIIKGANSLKGAPVMATDLRASVSLVLAALTSSEETMVSRVYHLDRGYEEIENKLGACGAIIERVREGSVHDISTTTHPLKATG
ncbi:MAG: UDP-N-acetylglucosamine 1-carboxyvinyltransferase [Caedibacter sp. 38-128]|mgnify:CR=1 FL=1|nr:UDP-N-acetylglucosamine 1-carboxyvinyltransferase [Holosporales bacterium]OJX07985.1 MAG: UDP-N-acetylglucosamine 1-carboxyvinyltransferase [Caedibacter sp. 38-128]